MKFSDIKKEVFWSICCGAKIICHDGDGHGNCSECGDNTTPDIEIQEKRKETTRKKKRMELFDCLFWVLLAIIFLLLLMSCNSYKQLNGKPCESLYTLPVSSPFFTVSYHRGKREVYLLTDLRLANNKSHYLQHPDTCESIQVSSIEQKGDLFKMTFHLKEDQFICYERHLNESNITYCTRSNQEL